MKRLDAEANQRWGEDSVGHPLRRRSDRKWLAYFRGTTWIDRHHLTPLLHAVYLIGGVALVLLTLTGINWVLQGGHL